MQLISGFTRQGIECEVRMTAQIDLSGVCMGVAACRLDCIVSISQIHRNWLVLAASRACGDRWGPSLVDQAYSTVHTVRCPSCVAPCTGYSDAPTPFLSIRYLMRVEAWRRSIRQRRAPDSRAAVAAHRPTQ